MENTRALDPFLLGYKQIIEDLLKNKNRTDMWEAKRKSHEELRVNMKTYTSKLRVPVQIPIGKKCLMKGHVYHTNEFTISIGAGWFVKVSAQSADEICQRRINECTEMLQALEKERNLLESRLTVKRDGVFPNFDEKEIVEEFDEEQENKWREEHKAKVQAHKQKLSELEEKKRKQPSKTEQDLWEHLDYLEMKEELEDEIDRLQFEAGIESTDSEEVDDSEDEPEESSDSEESIEPVKPSVSSSQREKKRVRFVTEEKEIIEEPQVDPAISDQIIEHSVTQVQEEPKKRPVSQFKKSRMAGKSAP